MTANTDGAAIYKSVLNKSIWPIHLQQNYLSPSKRFKTSNILLAAMYFGTAQPNMQQLFYPMLKELIEIQNEGGIKVERNGRTYEFMPMLINCCCDLPAKAKVQCITSHAGHYACSYCLDPGTLINAKQDDKSKSKSYVRYIYGNYAARTHSHMLQTYSQVKTNERISGIHGLSCMVAAEGFDLVHGYNIDYMHCVLLGMTKKLLDLWLNSTNHREEYYINKRKHRQLDQRLCSIKPTSNVGVKPLSIFNRSNYKAKNYRMMLLFYLGCCLPGCQDQKYINNFQLLSSSIYILLKERIMIEDCNQAEKMLDQFAKTFENLYGKDKVTMNLHLIRHMNHPE